MVITVVCPSCATSFPVDPAKIPVGGVQARCTSCAEVFRVERPEEAAPPSPGTSMAVMAPSVPTGTRDEERPGADEAAAVDDTAEEDERAEEAERVGDEDAAEAPAASVQGTDEAAEVEDVDGSAPGAAYVSAVETEADEAPEDPVEVEREEAAAPTEDSPTTDDEWATWAYGDPTAVVEDAVEEADAEDVAGEYVEPEDDDQDEDQDEDDSFEVASSAPLEGAGGGADSWGSTLPDAGMETHLTSEEEDEVAARWAMEPDDVDEEAVEEAEALDWVFETDDEMESAGEGDAWTVEASEEPAVYEADLEETGTELDEAPAVEASAWSEPTDTEATSGFELEAEEREPGAEEETGTEETGTDWVSAAWESGPAEDRDEGGVAEPSGAFAQEAVEDAPPQEAISDEVVLDEEPAIKGFSFGQRDPDDRARRLARVLVSDMIMYNPERHQRALKNGTLEEDFQEEIDKSWKEYVDQVGSEMAEGTRYWTSALNDILAKGETVF